MLVATACGARWSGSQRASVLGRYRSGGLAAGTSADGSTAGSAGDTNAAAANGAAAGPQSAAAGSKAGGAAAAAAKAGSTSAGAAPSSLPCAAPSTAPGVSPTTITVGSISTLTGPVPGLGAGAQAAIRAYGAYVNANGGVCGRKVVVKTADDAYDNAQGRSKFQEMEPQVLGIVGGLASSDPGYADLLTADKVPGVTEATSDQFQAAPTEFDVNPPYANVHAASAKYKWMFGQGVHKAALIWFSNSQSRENMQGIEKPLMQAAGIQVVNEQELPLSTLSFDPAARAVANSGADYVYFLAAGNLNSSFARSMANTGYKLKLEEFVSAYDSDFVSEVGPAADQEPVVNWIRFLPDEERASNPMADNYLRWMAQTAPGVPHDIFAADSWASGVAFFDALQQLKGPITRDALIAQLKTFASFDAHGFFGAINLGGKTTNGCFVAVKVVSGKWQRLTPAQGFLC
ncbi:MAG TPA: ABC transporter substrate-binding protein [Acidimicrobiales bacterium]|jgi:ABC-type branched-subunit amino acid transport system substrate-binding protein|nr:ABC transporter substrate-binding protein [Acidimicrobiales bacterium]